MKISNYSLSPFWLFLLLFIQLNLLVACAPDRITSTPELTPKINSTSTPVNMPPTIPHTTTTGAFELDSFTWDTNPVLISVQDQWGYDIYHEVWSYLPELIIYSNGTVIGSSSGSLPWISRMSQEEMCNTLISINQTGYLDYSGDGDTGLWALSGDSTTHININAWNPQETSVESLAFAEEMLAGEGSESPALVELAPVFAANNLLRGLEFIEKEPYIPSRVLLLVEKDNFYDEPAELWGVSDLPLSSLDVDYSGEFYFEGELATQLFDYFSQKRTRIFEENNVEYQITMRPLLPFEVYPSPKFGWGYKAHFETEPHTEMTCQNEIIAIPEPSFPVQISEPTPTTVPSLTEFYTDRITIIDTIGKRDAPSQFHLASGMAITPEGNLLVADNGNDRWQIFSPHGELLEIKPSDSEDSAELHFLPDGNLLAVNWWQNRVEKLSPNGQLLTSYSDWPEPEGGYDYPTDHVDLISYDANGRIFVTEDRSNRVIILNQDGTFQTIWNGPEDSPFQLITDMDRDQDGNIYVVDHNGNQIVMLDPSGQHTIANIGQADNIALRDDGTFYIRTDNHISLRNIQGDFLDSWTIDLSFRNMVASQEGGLFILESTFSDKDGIIHHFDSEGQLLNSFGSSTRLENQFDYNEGVTVAKDDTVWILASWDVYDGTPGKWLIHLDTEGKLIQSISEIDGHSLDCGRYSLDTLSDGLLILADGCTQEIFILNSSGEIVSQWGERGLSGGQFNLIVDLVYEQNSDSLFILDKGNQRLSQYSAFGQLEIEYDLNQWGAQYAERFIIENNQQLFFLLPPNQILIVDLVANTEKIISVPFNYTSLVDITVDGQREIIFVIDESNGIHLWDFAGEYQGSIGVGRTSSAFLDITSDGNLYLSTGDSRIYITSTYE